MFMPEDQHAVHLIVPDQYVGKRVDVALSSLLHDCSRNRAADLLKLGIIKIGGEAKKPGYRVRAGDLLEGQIPALVATAYGPEAIPLNILHEDDGLIVINKPPGMVVHPAAGHTSGTLVNALLYHCDDLKGIGGELRPGIVHRLDKDTSGTMVVAKTEPVLNDLAAQFKVRHVKKTYLAYVYREPNEDEGDITLPIGRHPVHRKRMSVNSKRSRTAQTHWKVRERFEGAALLEIVLKTGRTHQIRVHCAALKHPIIGDTVYGSQKLKKAEALTRLSAEALRSVKRQMLHSWQLSFTHPLSGEWVSFESPMPEDMRELQKALKKKTALEDIPRPVSRIRNLAGKN